MGSLCGGGYERRAAIKPITTEMYRDQLKRNNAERAARIARRREAVARWQFAHRRINTARVLYRRKPGAAVVAKKKRKKKKKKRRRGSTQEERDAINARRHNRKRRQPVAVPRNT